jgi:hypothetical protein
MMSLSSCAGNGAGELCWRGRYVDIESYCRGEYVDTKSC